MRKIFTLSLAVAGLMTFSASAAAPETLISLDENVKTIEMPAKKDMNLSLQSRLQKSTMKKTPVKDGVILDGTYVFNTTNLRKLDGTASPVNTPLEAYIFAVEGEENTYAVYMTAFSDDPTPIEAKYDPATGILTIFKQQTFYSEQDPDYGTLNFMLWNVISPQQGYVRISEDTDLHFVLNGREFAPVYSEGTNYPLNDYGVMYIGAEVEVNGQTGLVGYGYFLDTTISEWNSIGITDNNGAKMQIYPYVEPTTDGGLNIYNMFSLGTANYPVKMVVDRTNKTVTTDGLQAIYFEDEAPFYWINSDFTSLEDALPVGTYEVKVIGDNNDVTVTDITFAAATMGLELENNYYVGEYTNTLLRLPWDLNATNAIEGIATDIENANAPVEYFNIQGVKVNGENLSNGVYVRRQGNEVKKVFVK